MPCSLLLATPCASGAVRTVLHSADTAEADGDGVSNVAGASGVGPLVGLVLELDCRVACTVELLWDVDLAFLGGEMHVDRKL